MNTATFDPNSFLDQAVKGALDTKIIPPPNGGPYAATIDKVDVRQVQRKDGTGSFLSCDILCKISDPTVAKATGREVSFARFSTILGVVDDGKGGTKLDMSPQKNVKLGQVREAVGLNDPKKDFFIRQLVGLPLGVYIKQEILPDESVVANVNRVEKAKRG